MARKRKYKIHDMLIDKYEAWRVASIKPEGIIEITNGRGYKATDQYELDNFYKRRRKRK